MQRIAVIFKHILRYALSVVIDYLLFARAHLAQLIHSRVYRVRKETPRREYPVIPRIFFSSAYHGKRWYKKYRNDQCP
jgi:hypothetical protein